MQLLQSIVGRSIFCFRILQKEFKLLHFPRIVSQTLITCVTFSSILDQIHVESWLLFYILFLGYFLYSCSEIYFSLGSLVIIRFSTEMHKFILLAQDRVATHITVSRLLFHNTMFGDLALPTSVSALFWCPTRDAFQSTLDYLNVLIIFSR